MWIELREVDSSYAGGIVEVLSAVIIIAQNDMFYLMKINLEQLFYESGHGGMIETRNIITIVWYFFRGSCFKKKHFSGKFLSLSHYCLLQLSWIMNVLTLWKDFFTSFFHILHSGTLIKKAKKKQKGSLWK